MGMMRVIMRVIMKVIMRETSKIMKMKVMHDFLLKKKKLERSTKKIGVFDADIDDKKVDKSKYFSVFIHIKDWNENMSMEAFTIEMATHKKIIHEDGKKWHTAYTIVIKSGKRSWSVEHRYSDFVTYVRELKAEGLTGLPKLPSKTFKQLKKEEALRSRSIELYQFMLDLLTIGQTVLKQKRTKEFLELYA